MFYAQFVLLKKGPLARIWLAAHWEKKLTKAQIYETDIDKAVDYILEPRGIRMALRTTGHLLLGVVKIYSRKTKYLLADCNDTCTRMRLAFRPGIVAVDLPEDHLVAPLEAINCPEVFHDFDSAGMDISLNQSRYEDITMVEPPPLNMDEVYNIENAYGFGDEEEIEARRGASSGRFAAEDLGQLRGSVSGRLTGGMEGQSGNQIDFGQLMVDDVNMEPLGPENVQNNDNDPPVVVAVSSPARNEFRAPLPVQMSPIPDGGVPRPSDVHGMTTLLSNAADGFVLPPLDDATALGVSRQRGARKRRRCLMVDEKISIDPEVMKGQIKNYKDTVRLLDLAPDTKRKMYIKERVPVDKLLSLPCIEVGKDLMEIYRSSLKSPRIDGEGDGIGITLVDINPEAPQVGPLFEDVEMQRNQNHEDPGDFAEMENRSFNQPLPVIPEEMVDTPNGNENAPPLPFMGSVLGNSAFPAMSEPLAEEPPMEQPLLERNSSTPIPQKLTPRKSPRKSRPSSEQGERGLDVSHSSVASVTWDTQARKIVSELKKLVLDGEGNPEIKFSELIIGRDTRKVVARKFYAVLQLKKAQAINVHQDTPYGEITITTGAKFYA